MASLSHFISWKYLKYKFLPKIFTIFTTEQFWRDPIFTEWCVIQNTLIYRYQMYFWSMYYLTIMWIDQKRVGQMNRTQVASKKYFLNAMRLYWTEWTNKWIVCMANCPQECDLFITVKHPHFVKPHSILNLAVWNIFNIQSALRAIQKLFYCKVPQKHMIISKKSPKMTKKSLPTICLIAYMESTIIYNPGQPIEWFHQRETCGCAKYIHNFWSSHTVWSICLMVQ